MNKNTKTLGLMGRTTPQRSLGVTATRAPSEMRLTLSRGSQTATTLNAIRAGEGDCGGHGQTVLTNVWEPSETSSNGSHARVPPTFASQTSKGGRRTVEWHEEETGLALVAAVAAAKVAKGKGRSHGNSQKEKVFKLSDAPLEDIRNERGGRNDSFPRQQMSEGGSSY